MFSSIMKLFGKEPRRYVGEGEFRRNRTKQTAMTPLTLAQLRKYGVGDLTELKLEFFFYTNTETKALALVAVLEQKGYSVEQKSFAKDESVKMVTGWTTKMKMSDAAVITWTREMCEVGFSQDCDFDGWGTNPKQ